MKIYRTRHPGVPSPARLHQMEQTFNLAKNRTSSSRIVSPLVHTVPLLFKNSNSIENRNFPAPSSILGQGPSSSPAAETPVQILLSECGSIGVAFLHHSTGIAAWSSSNGSVGGGNASFSESPATQEEDILGTIVIFEPPGFASNRDTAAPGVTKSFRCSNVRIGGWNSFTIRNALWPTTIIPSNRGYQQSNDNTNNMDSKEESSPLLSCHLFPTPLSAYMLFNDEDDGFRITWITIGDDDSVENCLDGNEGLDHTVTNSPNAIRPTRTDIVAPSDDGTRGNWEECISDPETGRRHMSNDDDISSTQEASEHHRHHQYSGSNGPNCLNRSSSIHGINIAYESYLHVDALLSDILSRRSQRQHTPTSIFTKSPYHQNLLSTFLPDFYYNLISASSHNVVLVIVFSNIEKQMSSFKNTFPSSLGIVVEVNMFDQSYGELKWVQHPSCRDASSMKNWCAMLASNWRMKECRVGVFCLSEDGDDNKIGLRKQVMEQWVGDTHECNVDEDLEDDCNVDLWSEYVEQQLRRRRQRNSCSNGKKGGSGLGVGVRAPKDVSMSNLYPYCDVITNRAVHNAIPVKRMSCRNSPIELIYG
mmetsp:Transcript_16759/g.36307  ORF Transcript_16759/g.36307 Transcript_16759/m.36307 type:complete len:590 (-) Transcript_16759:107-1876(-)